MVPLKPVDIRFGKNSDGRKSGKSICCLLSADDVDDLEIPLMCRLIDVEFPVIRLCVCGPAHRGRGREGPAL